MASEKEKKVGFLITPKSRDQLIAVMDLLKAQGIKPTNEVMQAVLSVMAEEGKVLDLNEKDMKETIAKLVPKGGKILHIREQED